MLTLQLWRALNRSPHASPLYRWLYPANGGDVSRRRRAVMWLARIVMIALVLPGLAYGAVWLLMGAPYLVLLANTLYGLALAVDSSGGIARERERNTYDLLCTSPPGALGVHLSYCNGWIYHYWLYGWLTLAVALIGGVAVVLAPVLPGGVTISEVLNQHPDLALSLAVALVFAGDYFQSVVFGGLAAILAPAFTADKLNARILAASGFLLAQLSGYAAAYTFALTLANTLQTFDNPALTPLLPLMSAAAFFIFREAIILVLWRAVTHIFGAHIAPAKSL
jgi:uncharacterized protein (DUF58 family)